MKQSFVFIGVKESMKKRIIVLVGLVIVLGGVIGITYSFFSTGGIQDTANTFTSGCLNITLTSTSNSISMNNTYPITDIEGLDKTSYDFTITNTCSSVANYEINLESISEQANSLNADYIKVSLSSNTTGNIISVLSDNTSITTSISNAYELNDKTLTVNLTDNVTSATYCTTTDNICTPNISANITNNSYTVELEGKEEDQMVCTKLNGTSKVICSDGLEVRKPTISEVLLANYPTQLTRSSFTSTVTNTTTDTIYYADTSKGRTYYFAGNPTDNWVKFGGFYWRIIRINEDGTLRLIYQGTSANTKGTGTQIGTSTFSINSSTYNNNAYVGYMYTIGSLRGTSTESGIKKVVDDWYEANIKGTEYENSISTETGFCGDRTPSTDYSSINNSGGTGTTVTYYAPYVRLYGNSKQPTFECSNDSDLYTVKGSSKGNKALDYPVGLITMDEVWYAGGYTSSNSSYYLYTGQYYWTLSPYSFDYGFASVFYVTSSGNLSINNVRWAGPGVRPVINLKADVQITGGNGSSDSPFEII